jgi:hypothetical protein
MPADVLIKGSTLAVEAKHLAAILDPVTVIIPITPFSPASLVVAIAAVINLPPWTRGNVVISIT